MPAIVTMDAAVARSQTMPTPSHRGKLAQVADQASDMQMAKSNVPVPGTRPSTSTSGSRLARGGT
jgi:hypothetical protein